MPNIIPIESILSPCEIYDKVKVFINGTIVGISNEPYELYLMMKDKKYKGIINIYTSIIFNYKMKEIRICNDGGRLSRPLLKVKDKNILLTTNVIDKLKNGEYTWNDLLTNRTIDDSIIEYIDAEEQSLSMIATTPAELFNKEKQFQKFSHCEIHPSTIFGILGSCIPFPEHNQSPRNTYQCLDINESVLLSNGSKIPIKDIHIGDEVVSFNPETMETSYTKVVNHYVRETDKVIYKITTLSGREIIATEDHKFMTGEGWCQVKDMSINETKIGILPHQNRLDNYNSETKIILTEEQFKEFFVKNNFNENLIDKYVTGLKNLDLLPLVNTNYKLPLLARMFGFLLADGSINIYERNNNKFAACSFDFGTETDVKMFENDVELCGFNKCKYTKATRLFNDVTYTTYAVTHNAMLPALLLALGISYGKKTEHERKEVPQWIYEGNKLIKREFLSGFQGGDGCRIRWYKMDKGYNFVCAETSQQINPKYVGTLVHFMNQCATMLRDFGLEISDIKQCKMEENSIEVSYKISDKQVNLINYFDCIGYRYSSTKNNQSFIVIEYLKFKHTLFEEHAKVIKTIRDLADKNNSNIL